MLAQYNAVDPNAASLILGMMKEEGDHRRKMEVRVLDVQERQADDDISARKQGLAAGFTVAMSFLAGSIYLIATGHDVSGTILGTVDLVALVSIFVLRVRGNKGVGDGDKDEPPSKSPHE